MESQDIGRNVVCDSLRCIVDRVARQVGVARCGLNVAVTEQLADHPQGLLEGQRAGREGMPEVVNSPIFQAGAPMDAPPGLLKVGRC